MHLYVFMGWTLLLCVYFCFVTASITAELKMFFIFDKASLSF
jgi:hypothetical protein